MAFTKQLTLKEFVQAFDGPTAPFDELIGRFLQPSSGKGKFHFARNSFSLGSQCGKGELEEVHLTLGEYKTFKFCKKCQSTWGGNSAFTSFEMAYRDFVKKQNEHHNDIVRVKDELQEGKKPPEWQLYSLLSLEQSLKTNASGYFNHMNFMSGGLNRDLSAYESDVVTFFSEMCTQFCDQITQVLTEVRKSRSNGNIWKGHLHNAAVQLVQRRLVSEMRSSEGPYEEQKLAVEFAVAAPKAWVQVAEERPKRVVDADPIWVEAKMNGDESNTQSTELSLERYIAMVQNVRADKESFESPARWLQADWRLAVDSVFTTVVKRGAEFYSEQRAADDRDVYLFVPLWSDRLDISYEYAITLKSQQPQAEAPSGVVYKVPETIASAVVQKVARSQRQRNPAHYPVESLSEAVVEIAVGLWEDGEANQGNISSLDECLAVANSIVQ